MSLHLLNLLLFLVGIPMPTLLTSRHRSPKDKRKLMLINVYASEHGGRFQNTTTLNISSAENVWYLALSNLKVWIYYTGTARSKFLFYIILKKWLYNTHQHFAAVKSQPLVPWGTRLPRLYLDFQEAFIFEFFWHFTILGLEMLSMLPYLLWSW